MRSKYKRREKANTLEKKSQILENNISHSSTIDIQKIPEKKVQNSIFERTKPFYNRYNKINTIKGKNEEKNKKVEKVIKNEKIKQNNEYQNNINNKEIQNRYKKLNINTNKEEKRLIQDNKINIANNNDSKLLAHKPRVNNFYNSNKIINNKYSNKEIINNKQNNEDNNNKKLLNNNKIESQMNNNNNIKYIYRKEKLIPNLKESNIKINELYARTKKNNIPSQINQNNLEEKKINQEPEQKQSFKYLVHQASKSIDLSNSFHRYYESRQLKSREKSAESSINNDTIKSENTSLSKHKFRNLSILKSFNIKENYSSNNINTNNKEGLYNSLTDRKMEICLDLKNNVNNIKIINFNYDINKKDSKIDINNNNNIINTTETKVINKGVTQNVINNNIYSTTLNFFKINNVYKPRYPKSKYLSANNIMENDDIIYEDEPNINKINTKINLNNINNHPHEINLNSKQKKFDEYSLASSSSASSNNYKYININLEYIISLEKRIKLLLEKINKYQTCDKECLEYISYFFNNKIYNEEIKAFKHKHNQNNFLYNIKIELLCFFLCYDISLSKSFNQTAILFKTIFNLIHSNFLIYISFLINNYNINPNTPNGKIIQNLWSIIEQELKINIKKQEMNDYGILQLIANNSKDINNYYKMIIDNIYLQYNNNSNDNNIRFPQILKNKKENILENLNDDKIITIKASFFFDAYRLLTNYNIDDLYDFFNIFLNKKENPTKQKILGKGYINQNYKHQIKTRNKNNNNNITDSKHEKLLLPKIKNNYKYSLVLDLDETLICIKRDINNKIKINKNNNLITVILRPGLLDFLNKMKKLYELILFSSGTSEYVSPIIKNIEKNEKYFEHILYREHVTYDDNGSFFKNLNLLNRDVKNVLIVDDNPKNFKHHKSNGICIKSFYGDTSNDKNTLKILGTILYKIRYDADKEGDIRISLGKEKNSMLFLQITNNY